MHRNIPVRHYRLQDCQTLHTTGLSDITGYRNAGLQTTGLQDYRLQDYRTTGLQTTGLQDYRLQDTNHTLIIEKGRHKEIPKGMRVCQFCPKSLENELHFFQRVQYSGIKF